MVYCYGATSYSTGGLGKAAELRPVPEPVRSCSSSTEGSREPMEVAGCGGSAQLGVCSPTSPGIPLLDDCPGKTNSGVCSGTPGRST